MATHFKLYSSRLILQFFPNLISQLPVYRVKTRDFREEMTWITRGETVRPENKTSVWIPSKKITFSPTLKWLCGDQWQERIGTCESGPKTWQCLLVGIEAMSSMGSGERGWGRVGGVKSWITWGVKWVRRSPLKENTCWPGRIKTPICRLAFVYGYNIGGIISTCWCTPIDYSRIMRP